jgi:lipopolysaccharide export system permease protein
MPNFFPSRTITLYVAKMFIVRVFAVLAVLLMILQVLDLLSESDKVLAAPGNGSAQIWTYVSLRLPQLTQRFLPFCVLGAAILTMSTLNANSEVVSMKAAGLSAHQILAPLLVASLGIAIVSFAFNERIVVRAAGTLDRWEAAKFGPLPTGREDKLNVWVKAGDDLIAAAIVSGRHAATILKQVTVYNRNGGVLSDITQAQTGVPAAGGGWLLTNARRFDAATGIVTIVPQAIVARSVRPDQFTLSNVDPAGLSLAELDQAITDLEAAGRPVGALQAAWWHKLSGPLSTVLMPLLSAIAAFGLARSGRLFVRAVIGMALGFAYFVADNFGLAMGNLGAYPPLLAAWGPFVLFALIGEAVLIRTEE